jgi:hypothetical protein
MTNHVSYIHGFKLEAFSPPKFCQSGARLEEYTYYYQKGHRQVAGKLYYASEQRSSRVAA